VADQHQAQGELPQPALGDRELKEDGFGLGDRRGESLIEGVVGVVELLVDELATDEVFLGELGDGLSGEGITSELLADLRRQLAGDGGSGGEGNAG